MGSNHYCLLSFWVNNHKRCSSKEREIYTECIVILKVQQYSLVLILCMVQYLQSAYRCVLRLVWFIALWLVASRGVVLQNYELHKQRLMLLQIVILNLPKIWFSWPFSLQHCTIWMVKIFMISWKHLVTSIVIKMKGCAKEDYLLPFISRSASQWRIVPARRRFQSPSESTPP